MIFDRKIGFEVKVTSLFDSSVEKILRKLYANSDEKKVFARKNSESNLLFESYYESRR